MQPVHVSALKRVGSGYIIPGNFHLKRDYHLLGRAPREVKMRKLALLGGILVFLGLPARAQEYPGGEFFGGFSYANTDIGGRDNFIGWRSNKASR